MDEVRMPEQDERLRILSELSSADWRVRQQAVETIVAFNNQELAEAVLELAKNQTGRLELLSGALKALQQIGRPLQAEMIALLQDPSSDLRLYIPIVLGEMGDQAAVPALSALVVDASVNENERFNAIEALGKLRAEAAGEALREVLRSGSNFLRYASILALGEIGYTAAEPDLIAVLDDDYLSEPAVAALGVIGSDGSAADIARWFNHLVKRSQCDQGGAARSVVAIARRSSAPEAVRSAFLAVLSKEAEECLIRLAVEADPQVANEILDSLAEVLGWLAVARGTPEVYQALTSLLHHPDACPAAEAALLRLPEEAQPQFVPFLLEMLQSSEGANLVPAVRLLGAWKSAEAVPVLIETLTGEEEDFTAQAAYALGQICDMEAVEPLLDLLGHPAVQVRKAAVGALAVLNPPELSARLNLLVEHGDSHRRAAALSLLAMLDETMGAARALQAVSDPDMEVRRLAVELLPRFHDPQVVPALRQALVDPDPAMRISAARACASLAPDVALSLLLPATQDENGWVRMQAVRSLALHARPEIIEHLARGLRDSLAPVRIASVDALARLPRELVEAYLRAGLEDENEEVRQSAENALHLYQD